LPLFTELPLTEIPGNSTLLCKKFPFYAGAHYLAGCLCTYPKTRARPRQRICL
jgi:hypothetical protein